MHHCPVEPDPIHAVLAEWQSKSPKSTILALLPEAEKEQTPVLQQTCQRLGLPLAGAIFPALIREDRFETSGVWLYRLDEPATTFLLPEIEPDPIHAAHALARRVEACLEGFTGTQPALFLIFDAMVPNIGSIVDELYARLADRVTYGGVNAGSETFQPMPCLFDADAVASRGVAALLLPQTSALALSHGYDLPAQTMTATSTEGNRVRSIDWRPAFDVYQEVIRKQYDVDLTRENFYQYAVHYPLAMVRANNELVIRIPVALEADGSVFCVGEIPENAMLVLTHAPDPAATRAPTELAEELRQRDSGTSADTEGLLFYCAGRRMHFGTDVAQQEVARVSGLLGMQQLAGALTLGEIGSTNAWGYPMFHNACLVGLTWGRHES
jgi:hypothetical protein